MNENDARSQGAELWKQLYRTAVLETKRELVPRRLMEARKAAGARAILLIRETSDDEAELQDLAYASRVLDELAKRFQSGKQSGTEHSTSESQVWTTQEQAS
jgi:hypothetical protein